MKTIAIFKNHPECSNQCVSGMITALSSEYRIRVFSVNSDLNYILSKADCVAIPGGFGDADTYYKFFKRRHGNAVADFVAGGGKYLGICMGQYWAGSEYFDILDGIDVVQYIKMSDSDIKRPYGTVSKVMLENYKREHMFFYDGGVIIDTKENSSYKIKARYDNGQPMAIIQGNVGIIGCHPESEMFWYDLYPYIKDEYHFGNHHKWLLDFTDELMESWPSGRRHLTANEAYRKVS